MQLWEISLPLPVINFKFDTVLQQTNMIDDIKLLAQKGHDIFSLISDKLAILPQDIEGTANLKTLLAKDLSIFKQKIDDVQLKLTSPTIESKNYSFDSNEGAPITISSTNFYG